MPILDTTHVSFHGEATTIKPDDLVSIQRGKMMCRRRHLRKRSHVFFNGAMVLTIADRPISNVISDLMEETGCTFHFQQRDPQGYEIYKVVARIPK